MSEARTDVAFEDDELRVEVVRFVTVVEIRVIYRDAGGDAVEVIRSLPKRAILPLARALPGVFELPAEPGQRARSIDELEVGRSTSIFTATAPAQWRAAVELDTLAAAWSFAPAEMAALIGVNPGTIDGWRRSEEVGWTKTTAARVADLRRLHEYLWISVPYADWPQWWRRRWRADSTLSGRSPLEAVLADRDPAIRQLSRHLSALAQPGYL